MSELYCRSRDYLFFRYVLRYEGILFLALSSYSDFFNHFIGQIDVIVQLQVTCIVELYM